MITEKKCTRCLKVQSLNKFSKDIRQLDGYKGYCKHCVSAINRARSSNPETVKARQQLGYKTCSKCSETKKLHEFGVKKRNPDGLQYMCRRCLIGIRRKETTRKVVPRKAPVRKVITRKAHANKAPIKKDVPAKKDALLKQRKEALLEDPLKIEKKKNRDDFLKKRYQLIKKLAMKYQPSLHFDDSVADF